MRAHMGAALVFCCGGCSCVLLPWSLQCWWISGKNWVWTSKMPFLPTWYLNQLRITEQHLSIEECGLNQWAWGLFKLCPRWDTHASRHLHGWQRRAGGAPHRKAHFSGERRGLLNLSILGSFSCNQESKKTLPHGLSEQEQGDHHSGLPGTVLVCKYQCRHKRDSGGTVLKTFDNFNFCTLQMVIDRGTKVKFKNNKRNAGLDTVGQTNVKSYQNNNPELSVQRSNSTHPLAL